MFVFFGVFKGIGSIGWAVSITATIPYLMLIVLLLRALSLKGAADGIYYFLKPDFRELWSINVTYKVLKNSTFCFRFGVPLPSKSSTSWASTPDL